VERDGARLEPLSGQFVLNFETRELGDKLRVISERSAEEWFALALEFEAERRTWSKAIDAYDHALRIEPRNVEAMVNCGTLCYEQGNLEKACDYFRRAVAADPHSALSHSNLGSVLEEMGELEEARRHLRQAARLDPGYPDARYNLALVCEKLGAYAEAREHWQSYIQLDPSGPCSDYARQRLASFKLTRLGS